MFMDVFFLIFFNHLIQLCPGSVLLERNRSFCVGGVLFSYGRELLLESRHWRTLRVCFFLRAIVVLSMTIAASKTIFHLSPSDAEFASGNGSTLLGSFSTERTPFLPLGRFPVNLSFREFLFKRTTPEFIIRTSILHY